MKNTSIENLPENKCLKEQRINYQLDLQNIWDNFMKGNYLDANQFKEFIVAKYGYQGNSEMTREMYLPLLTIELEKIDFNLQEFSTKLTDAFTMVNTRWYLDIKDDDLTNVMGNIFDLFTAAHTAVDLKFNQPIGREQLLNFIGVSPKSNDVQDWKEYSKELSSLIDKNDSVTKVTKKYTNRTTKLFQELVSKESENSGDLSLSTFKNKLSITHYKKLQEEYKTTKVNHLLELEEAIMAYEKRIKGKNVLSTLLNPNLAGFVWSKMDDSKQGDVLEKSEARENRLTALQKMKKYAHALIYSQKEEERKGFREALKFLVENLSADIMSRAETSHELRILQDILEVTDRYMNEFKTQHVKNLLETKQEKLKDSLKDRPLVGDFEASRFEESKESTDSKEVFQKPTDFLETLTKSVEYAEAVKTLKNSLEKYHMIVKGKMEARGLLLNYKTDNLIKQIFSKKADRNPTNSKDDDLNERYKAINYAWNIASDQKRPFTADSLAELSACITWCEKHNTQEGDKSLAYQFKLLVSSKGNSEEKKHQEALKKLIKDFQDALNLSSSLDLARRYKM